MFVLKYILVFFLYLFNTISKDGKIRVNLNCEECVILRIFQLYLPVQFVSVNT